MVIHRASTESPGGVAMDYIGDWWNNPGVGGAMGTSEWEEHKKSTYALYLKQVCVPASFIPASLTFRTAHGARSIPARCARLHHQYI